MSDPIIWQIRTVSDHKRLTVEQIDLILECQRALLCGNIGVFGLTTELEFLFASAVRGDSEVRNVGLIAWRPNGDEVWVQLAYVRQCWRKQGCLRALVHALESQHPNTKIGFGVTTHNVPMVKAMWQLGYEQPTSYFYKTTGAQQ